MFIKHSLCTGHSGLVAGKDRVEISHVSMHLLLLFTGSVVQASMLLFNYLAHIFNLCLELF